MQIGFLSFILINHRYRIFSVVVCYWSQTGECIALSFQKATTRKPRGCISLNTSIRLKKTPNSTLFEVRESCYVCWSGPVLAFVAGLSVSWLLVKLRINLHQMFVRGRPWDEKQLFRFWEWYGVRYGYRKFSLSLTLQQIYAVELTLVVYPTIMGHVWLWESHCGK